MLELPVRSSKVDALGHSYCWRRRYALCACIVHVIVCGVCLHMNGVVPDAFGAVTRESARATKPRLEWEKYRWAMEIVQRISIAAVKAAACEAMRVPHQP